MCFIQLKKIRYVILIILTFASQSLAGLIYGSISVQSGRLNQNLKIDIIVTNQNGSKEVFSGFTNLRGDYRIFVKNNRKCEFWVYYGNDILKTEVISYTEPAKYNFIILYDPKERVFKLWRQ